MPAGLTVADLVDRANPPNDAVRELWLHRARYWSAHGILPTLGRAHKGTGRHRRFHEETTYLAALLFRVANAGLPASVIEDIARAIGGDLADPAMSPFKERWNAAKAGEDAYLAIFFTDPEIEGHSSFLHIELESAMPTEITQPVVVSVIPLHLVFRAMQQGEP